MIGIPHISCSWRAHDERCSVDVSHYVQTYWSPTVQHQPYLHVSGNLKILALVFVNSLNYLPFSRMRGISLWNCLPLSSFVCCFVCETFPQGKMERSCIFVVTKWFQIPDIVFIYCKASLPLLFDYGSMSKTTLICGVSAQLNNFGNKKTRHQLFLSFPYCPRT